MNSNITLSKPGKEVKLPQYLSEIAELPRFIQENNIKLFSKEDWTVESLINHYIEQNKTDEAFFIIHLGVVLDQFKTWKTLLPRVEPYYAVKCCPDPLLLRILHLLGCNFDCASKQEIINVTELDIPSSKIIYANPVKDSHFIKFARSQDVDLMTFDNETELYKIKLYHPYANIIIRIKTNDAKSVCKFSSKFGCSVEDAKVLLEKAKFLELNVVGVSFHVGSKCGDTETYELAIKDAKTLFNMGKEMGMTMKILDVGGGFPGSESETPVKFEDIAKTINEYVDKYFGDVEDLRVIAEPGRYFASKSHTMVFNVIGRKKIEENGENKFFYYMNDGVYGCFNCIIFDGAQPEIYPFNERHEKKYKSTIFGPTCDSMDTIAKEIEMPELVVGEWCYVENFGAYTQAAASNFNGFEKIDNNYIFLY
jgi:ornithine decarboxylase